jgi:hypothetical protein
VVSSSEAPYDDMTSLNLISAFEAVKKTISKWIDEILENNLYFTA